MKDKILFLFECFVAGLFFYILFHVLFGVWLNGWNNSAFIRNNAHFVFNYYTMWHLLFGLGGYKIYYWLFYVNCEVEDNDDN